MDLSQLYMLEMMRKRRLGVAGYSTDGMILHLDGIQNTRAGTHNASATVWEDLSGNGMDVNLYNTTWGDDYAAFSGNADSYGRGSKWTFTTGCTIEIVMMRTGNFGSYGSTLAGWPINNNQTIMRPVLVGDTTAINVRYDSRTGYKGESTGLSPALNTKYHIGCIGGKMIQNGTFYSHSHYLYPEAGESRGDFMLANYLAVNGVDIQAGIGLSGRIFAVRCYDRYLSEAELLAHWAIDNARFGIV